MYEQRKNTLRTISSRIDATTLHTEDLPAVLPNVRHKLETATQAHLFSTTMVYIPPPLFIPH